MFSFRYGWGCFSFWLWDNRSLWMLGWRSSTAWVKQTWYAFLSNFAQWKSTQHSSFIWKVGWRNIMVREKRQFVSLRDGVVDAEHIRFSFLNAVYCHHEERELSNNLLEMICNEKECRGYGLFSFLPPKRNHVTNIGFFRELFQHFFRENIESKVHTWFLIVKRSLETEFACRLGSDRSEVSIGWGGLFFRFHNLSKMTSFHCDGGPEAKKNKSWLRKCMPTTPYSNHHQVLSNKNESSLNNMWHSGRWRWILYSRDIA